MRPGKLGSCLIRGHLSQNSERPVTGFGEVKLYIFGMEQCRRDDYDTDASLEYSDEETYQQFLEFYEDVLPEFQNVGKVVQFKVCI